MAIVVSQRCMGNIDETRKCLIFEVRVSVILATPTPRDLTFLSTEAPPPAVPSAPTCSAKPANSELSIASQKSKRFGDLKPRRS